MSTAIPNKVDKCKGAMLATAIGDALGWPNEQRSKNQNRGTNVNNYFVEWTRRNRKPCYHDEIILPGEYSDDTQLTLSVARSIISGNWENFFTDKELPFWLKYERGGGGALLKAAKFYNKGVLPWQSNYTRDYFNAGGNGAVMRILPHVITNAKNPDSADLMAIIIKNALITHGHPRAVLGATCYAFALNYLLRKEEVLEYGELVSAVIDGQKFWGAYLKNYDFGTWLEVANHHCNYEYVSEWEQVRSSMVNQLEFIQSSLEKGLILDDVSVLTHIGCFSKANGAGDVAILAAIYLASRYANNPALGIKVPAFLFGADTDTIASITGGLLGMLCGTNWIPTEWKAVQDYECLIRITDLLLADNIKKAGKSDEAEVASDWVNTAIGRMREVGTMTVQNGKYAIVTITKWKSALGQTLYMKDMHKLDDQPRHAEGQMQIPQQPTLYDVGSQAQPKTEHQSLAQPYATDFVNTGVAEEKTQGRFVLDEASITDLLENSQFKKNITIGKVLKIVKALIEGRKASAAIAKQFKVDQAIVDLIKVHVIK